MSGFKRMQSRVFWNQMARHDLDIAPLICKTSPERQIDRADASYCNFGRDSDTDTDKISENSFTAGDQVDSNCNITACFVTDKTQDDLPEENGNSSMVPEIENAQLARVLSPDQGHGSLDSGFSDSENSKSGNLDTSRRRRKRRKKRDGKVVNKNLFWMKPSHTSTPKAENIETLRNLTYTKDSEDFDEFRDSTDCAKRIELPDSPGSSQECLGDFLYEVEPPEDEASSASRDSTPSFNGPWYTRMSNESSKSSGSQETKSKFTSGTKTPWQFIAQSSSSSVQVWLQDLVQDVDNECYITLQSKALPRRNLHTEDAQTRDLKLLTTAATSAATELLVRAEGFNRHVQEVIRKIGQAEARDERDWLRSIEEEAFSILSELGAPPPRRIHDGSVRTILNQLESLKNMVNHTLDTRLDFYIERVVRGLEEAPRESGSAARGALAALTALGLAGSRAGNSIARCSGVRALLTSLISASRLSSELRASSLRALASVCCCPLAIDHFIKEGGPEILVDLLTSPSTPEREKIEATALIVQVTAPWIDALGLRHFEPFAAPLTLTLIYLAESCACAQTLLLCAAALNNLSDSPAFVDAILTHESIRRLIKCVKKKAPSIWLMEQVAMLINKLARHPKARKHLAKARASVALVCFLRMAPPGLEDAYHRLTVTAATALMRLCVDPEIAKQVVAVGGDDCLPKFNKMDDHQQDGGLVRYTNSLRIACKKATKCIDDAKACDYSVE
ncbi:protein inscuteable homolog [Microplitis mediator]|uniref:protein inscuteable homolog n=1 Tax=Microplitis mediator TaxID=375433 RepID=UPI0025578DAB|nr:protein inscuteable homolog [Microplitis mediator]